MTLNLENIFTNYSVVQNFREIEWLVNKVEKIIDINTKQNKPSTILEIGTQAGGSFKLWEQLLLQNTKCKDNLLIGIDLGNNITWDINKSDITVKMIIGNSHDFDTVKKLKDMLFDGRLFEGDLTRQLDFIYVDAEHNSLAAKKDFMMYSKFVKPGGALGFHDHFDVKGFLDILPKNRLETFTDQPPFSKYGQQAGIGTSVYVV